MKYGSVCSGIEAATVAWHPLGWEPAFFSEIEPFPSAVLKHHYPKVENRGDMTKFKEWPNDAIDLLVGGTPCQSFSVAGFHRKGLADPRGNLALVFLAIADRLRPRWLVWENVPGVLSSDEGRDFGCFLGGLGELGYGFAYRVLDAQYFGVPQRRRRPFVVGYLGDWRRAGAVLFERHCLQGNPAPSREAGEGVAPSVTQGPPFSRTGNERVEADAMVISPALCGQSNSSHRADSMAYVPTVRPAIKSRDYKGVSSDGDGSPLIVQPGFIHPRQLRNSQSSNQVGIKPEAHVSDALTSEGPGAVLTHSLRADGFDASEDGTGRGVPLTVSLGSDPIHARDLAHPVSCRNGDPGVVAFTQNQAGDVLTGDRSASMGTNQNATGRNTPKVIQKMRVRRLTPLECERLQGFPDGYTQVPYRKKPATDGPRYKALGNSMAVPVMRWIGERIAKVESGGR